MEKRLKDKPFENAAPPPPVSKSRMSILLRRVTVDSRLCHGEPCIRGMRIMVKTIVNSLNGGMSMDEILLRYPDLTPDDVEAAIIYSSRK